MFLCLSQDLEPDFANTTYAAKLSINRNKNRYINIIPCKSPPHTHTHTHTHTLSLCHDSPPSLSLSDDHSRVVLSLQENTPGSDYINSCYINVIIIS